MDLESYVVFAEFLAEVVQEEKTDKLTNFRSVETAHSYVEHVAPRISFTQQISQAANNSSIESLFHT